MSARIEQSANRPQDPVLRTGLAISIVLGHGVLDLAGGTTPFSMEISGIKRKQVKAGSR